MSTTATPQTLSLDERRSILQGVLRSDTQNGWQVISQTDTTAQLKKGKHTSHLLHLILTIVTLGLWLLVWIPLAIFGGEKQRYVQVDEWGNVVRT
jgi:hypothetical protein